MRHSDVVAESVVLLRQQDICPPRSPNVFYDLTSDDSKVGKSTKTSLMEMHCGQHIILTHSHTPYPTPVAAGMWEVWYKMCGARDYLDERAQGPRIPLVQLPPPSIRWLRTTFIAEITRGMQGQLYNGHANRFPPLNECLVVVTPQKDLLRVAVSESIEGMVLCTM